MCWENRNYWRLWHCEGLKMNGGKNAHRAFTVQFSDAGCSRCHIQKQKHPQIFTTEQGIIPELSCFQKSSEKKYNTKIENSTVLIWKIPSSLKAGSGSALRGPETAGLWLSSNESGKKCYGNREDLPWRRSLLEQPSKIMIYWFG